MEKLHKILFLFSKTYPQLKNVKIEKIEDNNLYIARCIGEAYGDYYFKKKNRLIDIKPTKILLTNKALIQNPEKIIFTFIHECAHGITPQVERRVKKHYIRIDHSRCFYENFEKLLIIANKNGFSQYKPDSIKELMHKDNRKENIENDYKIHSKSK